MLSRVIAKNIGDVFFETVYILTIVGRPNNTLCTKVADIKLGLLKLFNSVTQVTVCFGSHCT